MQRPSPQERVIGYALAVLATGVATAVRLLFGHATNLTFVTFYPAVMVSAWWGGRGPALVSVALCVLIADYYHWVPPHDSFIPTVPQDWMDPLLFLLVASAIGIVTARLRDSRERLRSVLDATHDGFAIIDREWRYTYVNRRFAELVRRPERDLVGARVWDLFPENETDRFAAIARAAMGGVRGHHTVYHERLGTWFDTTVYPVREGVAVVTRDVSAEQEIEARRAELLAKLEAANRLKDDFLATLSHELRTPLNALVGWAQLLDKATTPAPRAIRSIQRNAAVLTQLVNDLLDTARIMSGKLHMEMQPTNLVGVVHDATEIVRHSADEKGIVLRTDGVHAPVVVTGDGARLQQAVLNLLSNAIKFTPEGGRVEVALSEAPTSVTLTVKDCGVGIAPDVLPRIFDRFVQGGGPTAMRAGLGLGLAITKHIAEAHGGSVRAESDGPMTGATFSLVLPLAPTPHTPMVRTGDTRPPDAGALLGTQVLVVEDDQDAGGLLENALEQCGARVRVVSTVTGALEALKDAMPDIVIADLHLPGEDGMTLPRLLRSVCGRPLPVVAVSGYSDVPTRIRAAEAGFDEYLTKPWDLGQLVEVLETLKSGSGLSSDRRA